MQRSCRLAWEAANTAVDESAALTAVVQAAHREALDTRAGLAATDAEVAKVGMEWPGGDACSGCADGVATATMLGAQQGSSAVWLRGWPLAASLQQAADQSRRQPLQWGVGAFAAALLPCCLSAWPDRTCALQRLRS